MRGVRDQELGIRDEQVSREQGLGFRETISLSPNYLSLTTCLALAPNYYSQTPQFTSRINLCVCEAGEFALTTEQKEEGK
ncbi:MAG: hypothetical protein QMC80_05570 [Thermoplasmatales archaeon]|nr:hypothetical protein [Thermoplasmatales archaeon]